VVARHQRCVVWRVTLQHDLQRTCGSSLSVLNFWRKTWHTRMKSSCGCKMKLLVCVICVCIQLMLWMIVTTLNLCVRVVRAKSCCTVLLLSSPLAPLMWMCLVQVVTFPTLLWCSLSHVPTWRVALSIYVTLILVSLLLSWSGAYWCHRCCS